MKILVFSWRDQAHPWAGGSELNLFSQAKLWQQWGHEVTVFTASFRGAEREEIKDGIRIIRHGGRWGVYIWAVVYYLLFLRRSTDVILDIMNGIPFFTPLYSRKPIVALVHHVSSEQMKKELSAPLSALGNFLQLKLFPKVYRGKKIISVSPSTSEALKKIGIAENNITIIHNGLDHEMLRPTREKTTFPSIIYLGRLKKYKRLSLLIDAFTKILTEFPQARLFLVGTGDEETSLRNLTKKYNLADRVTFSGFVTDQEKVDLLSQSWVFVTPSLVEGWGLSVLEANACGTPAIAFAVPGLQNSIVDQKTGFLIHNPRELEDKLRLILSDGSLRDSLSQHASSWSQKFNWKRSAEESIKTLKNVCE